MATALYHYNDSTDYVAAVQDYAGCMRADPRAYHDYYNWQVLYARVGGLFILPVGYPQSRGGPLPVKCRLMRASVVASRRPLCSPARPSWH
jgi:hypothetical protein